MVKTINVITEPLEPFLYTKEWLSKNPLPPRTLKSRISRANNSPKGQQFQHIVKNQDVQLNSSQPKNFKETSFKEQVSGNLLLLFQNVFFKFLFRVVNFLNFTDVK